MRGKVLEMAGPCYSSSPLPSPRSPQAHSVTQERQEWIAIQRKMFASVRLKKRANFEPPRNLGEPDVPALARGAAIAPPLRREANLRKGDQELHNRKAVSE